MTHWYLKPTARAFFGIERLRWQRRGVMPKGFDFSSGLIRTPPELWVPLARPAQEWAVRGFHYFRVVGRLRDGITLPAAASEMAAIQTSIAAKDRDAFPRHAS
jgi:hypothetical protein